MLDLQLLQKIIPGLPDSWVTDQEKRAELVARYRRYTNGDHDAKLTTEMKELLRSVNTVNPDAPLADNYMGTVLSAMTDRLELQGIVSEDDQALSEWADALMSFNRLDGMQSALFESTIRDGNAYVMVGFDVDADLPKFTLEDAYDGTSGMLVWYSSASSDVMRAAIKIWAHDSEVLRVNVYYPNRVEKWFVRYEYAVVSGDFQPWNGTEDMPEPPVQTYDPAYGVPVVPFRNRAYREYGKSEIAQAIPLQDALNRTLQSLIMNSEYTGFPILVAKGFQPPTALKPGSIVTISGDAPLTKDQVADLVRLEAGSSAEFLAIAQWITSEIERVTQTPSPENTSPTSSGEARKQAEIGLIGKIKRFQIHAGNSFEDVVRKALVAQRLFGKTMPPADGFVRLRAQWTAPELRDDKGVVERAMLMRDVVGDKEVLRMVSPVYGYSEGDIERILDEKAQSETSRIAQLGSALPAFSLTAGQEPAQATGAAAVTEDNEVTA